MSSIDVISDETLGEGNGSNWCFARSDSYDQPVPFASFCGTTPWSRRATIDTPLRAKEESMEPRFPNVTVDLVGRDGNAFAILGRVVQALRVSDVPDEEIRRFVDEAQAGDYEHLLQTVMKWVEVI